MSVWDTQMNSDDDKGMDFPVLPEGRYWYEVTKAVGKEYNPKPGGKIGKCAQIELTMRVEAPKGQKDVTVFESLFSDPKMIWKMTQFAKSADIFHEGMTPGELIRKCEGAAGYADFVVEEYNGRKRNRVKNFVVSEKSTTDLPF